MGRFKRHDVGLCCILIFCCAWQSAPGAKQSVKTDLTTPSKSIQSFIAAVNSQNDRAASACVIGGKPSAALDELQRMDNLCYSHVDDEVFSCRDLQVQINGERAVVTLKLTIGADIDGHELMRLPTPTEERVELKRDGADWKIIPADLASLKAMLEKPAETMPRRVIMLSAGVYAYPDIFARARRRSVEVRCREHMKVLCLLALEYAADHNEKFGFKSDDYKKSLMPYYVKLQHETEAHIKDDKPLLEAELQREIAFYCPFDMKGKTSFSFNSNLSQLNQEAIDIPAETVLFYEGKNGKLDFRHDGKATVGFADGHAKTVDAEAAKQLVWLPYPGFHPKSIKQARRL